MKRVGIITIQKCDNFGADLQAYALGAKLRGIGYDAENIDYLFYKNPRHEKGPGEKPVVRLSVANRLKETLFPLVEALRRLRHCGKKVQAFQRLRAERFAAWFKANVRCGTEYLSVASLYENPPRYDVYMVGSDQVWNPRMGSNIKPYFLDFVPPGSRCVSYAASIGAAEIPAGAFYLFKKLLWKFSAIGVREKSAADIVRAMSLGVEVKQVVDPTLLLGAEEWERVAVCPSEFKRNRPYLLLYDLIASEETVAFAERIARERDLDVVRIGEGAYGPGEFVWLFAHANFVVTNSFHGTAFSLIFHRDFYSVVPRGMANAGRQTSVLEVVGARDRLIPAERIAAFDEVAVIDWQAVQKKLDAARDDSVAFLRLAVDGPDQRENPRLPLGCFAAWSVDDGIRAASTSGGMFRVLAERTIRRGGAVFGAAFREDFHRVEHRVAETIDALDPLMKSKYVWSDPTAAYRQAAELLNEGREILFAGTPCQIAALKNLVRGMEDKLITVDIVCHGTPRTEIFEEYAKELERRYGGQITKYEFRNKGAGWNFPRVNCEFSRGV